MLVLTRKVDQSIMIGEDIEIVITKITGRQVRIGIIADRDKHPALRKEIKNVDTNSMQFCGREHVQMRSGDNL